METSETKAELFKAFANFKKKLKQPLKDANNPFFKSKYVPLKTLMVSVNQISSIALSGENLPKILLISLKKAL